jgi:peptidoglycan/xylan/chitin deacetylase (PgdA/CDA1 family)
MATEPSSNVVTNNAVILIYHHVDDDAPPSTSVTFSRFKQHIQYLDENRFNIWPLSKILSYLSSGKRIPEKTVALTFDDAYRSVYQQAFPLLKSKSWPFTVFITTSYINDGYSNYMNWAQLKEMEEFGAEMANHSHTHPHMIRKIANETEEDWRKRIISEVETAQSILEDKLDKPVKLFAYPYGEYSKEIKYIMAELGYFALGQQSGVASNYSDLQSIPRFPIATGFDGMDSFATKVTAKDLPVFVVSPDDGILSSDTQIPLLTLQLKKGDYQAEQLACYGSEQGKIHIEWLDNTHTKLNVKANSAISPGRTKYNCTAPSKTENGVFYWFSYLWMMPKEDGSWTIE